jgi:flagellar assembly protein FliH
MDPTKPSTIVTARYLGPPRADLQALASTRALCDGARAELAKELQDARSRAAAHIRATRQRARERGYQNGVNAANLELAGKIAESVTLHRNLIQSANEDCLEVSLSITKQVLGEIVSLDPLALKHRIKVALSGLYEKRAVSIQVPTGTSEAIRSKLTAELNMQVNVSENSALSPGDSAIQTPSGTIQIRWEDSFRSAARAIRAKLSLVFSGEGDASTT